jgi:hexosaminidase
MTERFALLTILAGVAIAVAGASDVSAQPPPIAAAASAISVIPQPVSVTPRAGRFSVTPRTVIATTRANAAIGRQLAAYLEPATGFALRVQTTGAVSRNSITLLRDRTLERLGPEGYILDVRPTRVVLKAPELAGLFYGIQTLRQLLPADIFRDAPAGRTDWSMPAALIEDVPRFPWRGAHLDVGRHFMPKEFVKKYIDLLALHKLNTFHWHLTEDQGWRLEIRQYPRLAEIGAWRKETLVGRPTTTGVRQFDGIRHGGFYTQEDAREVVAYAKARFVNVVPEIEMPGHAMAAIAAYPEIGVTGEPVEVANTWGIFSDILNAEPSTVRFMQNVLDEVLKIFPSRYIHVGGDEADKAKWKATPRIQARIKELALADEHELQSWFVRQMDTFLTSHGRRLVGWDEILEGGLAENAVVMSWRGTKGGIAAARAGHDVVMAPTTHTYLDYYQVKDQTNEPLAIGGFLPLETVYSFEPIPEELEPQYHKHVLGGQGQVWTEYLPNPKKVEYMAFPRLTALAEAVWTAKARRDYADYLGRLGAHLPRLQMLDVNFRPLDVAPVTPAGAERRD